MIIATVKIIVFASCKGKVTVTLSLNISK